MKRYQGIRRRGSCSVIVLDGERQYDLPPRTDLRPHTEGEFEWGYVGAGPRQLALALLADCTRNDELAIWRYQHFHALVVRKLSAKGGFELAEEEIREALRQIEAGVVRAPGSGA